MPASSQKSETKNQITKIFVVVFVGLTIRKGSQAVFLVFGFIWLCFEFLSSFFLFCNFFAQQSNIKYIMALFIGESKKDSKSLCQSPNLWFNSFEKPYKFSRPKLLRLLEA